MATQLGNIRMPTATRPALPSAIIRGTLRADRRTKDLVKRLKPSDVALIHHADLDAVAARALAECRVSAVVNAVRSVSGKYPNGGPSVLLEAGIPLIDAVGEAFFEQAAKQEGSQIEIEGVAVRVGALLLAEGQLVTDEVLQDQLDAARGNLSQELDSFARNTLRYLAEEKSILLDPVEVPELKTKIHGRHAMVVVRGEGYKQDLEQEYIGAYIREVRPVLIGVDGGADALLDINLKPDIIIGDMDSVSDRALKCGAELVVHAYASGEKLSPGLQRVESLGLKTRVFPSAGTSEDIAMILADQLGASLIVAVGTHFSLEEFLDKGRGGMASTFLVRLRIGSKLVDAKGISRLMAQVSRPKPRDIAPVFIAFLITMGIILVNSPVLRNILNTFRLFWRSTFGH